MNAPPDGQGPKRVLVVDDHEDSLDLVREVLASAGHDVVTALDGESAVALLARESFDVALIDIGLPGIDGCEVARRARADHGPQILLVAVTGYAESRDRERSFEAGFDRHLVKPLDVPAVLGAIVASRGDAPPPGSGVG